MLVFRTMVTSIRTEEVMILTCGGRGGGCATQAKYSAQKKRAKLQQEKADREAEVQVRASQPSSRTPVRLCGTRMEA